MAQRRTNDVIKSAMTELTGDGVEQHQPDKKETVNSGKPHMSEASPEVVEDNANRKENGETAIECLNETSTSRRTREKL